MAFKSRKTKPLDLRIVDYYNEGKSYREIAAILGLKSMDTVSDAVFKHRDKVRRRGLTNVRQPDHKPATVANTVAFMPLGVRLDQLGQRNGCRWPIGSAIDDASSETLYCGLPGYPYCIHHAVKTTRKRNEAA
jgi:hypothetical protein